MSFFAIPPPALPGSGSRVESLRLSSQPGNTELPVRINFLRTDCPFDYFLVYPENRACQESAFYQINLNPNLKMPNLW